MSNYDPPQQPWGGQPQDPYGQPAYPPAPGGNSPDPNQPGAYPPAGYPQTPPTTPFPPSGPYPPGGSPGEAYPQPSGGGFPPPASGGGFPPPQPGYGQPNQGFPPPVGPAPGPYPPPRKGGAWKIVLPIVGLLVLLLCGGGIALIAYQVSKEDSPDPVASPSASRSPSPSPTPSQTPSSRSDPRTFVVGDCFVNDGTSSAPSLRTVPCGTTGAYQVTKRVPFVADTAQCGGQEAYMYDDKSGTSEDFTLCLRRP